MIDAYEQKHGPVEDRSIFSGDIVVPPHLRNISLANARSNRLHGSLLGSLSRSRTFLSLSSTPRQSFCGSVPDLSRNSLNENHNHNHHNDSYMNKRPNYMNSGDPNYQSMPPIRSKLLTSTDDIKLRFNPDDIQYRMHNSNNQNNNNNNRQAASMMPSSSSSQSHKYGDPQSSNGRPELDQSYTKGYMALIRTNNTNSLPNRHSSSTTSALRSPRYDVATSNEDYFNTELPSSMSTVTFHQSATSASTASSYLNELNVNVLSKYTIPRATLHHGSPLVSPNSERKYNDYEVLALKKDTHPKYEEDVSAV